MRSTIAAITSVFLLLNSVPARSQSAPATSTNVCKTETVFAFFNGVKTSRLQARNLLDVFEQIHGTTLPNNESIRYELMYNTSNDFEDFVETFEQRMREQNGLLGDRFELFFEAMNGGGDW
ncbi:MAG: hypothetical protein GZ090_12600, partial [Oxalobacteraceae bacterium]|nr:hypothetical protein [Oxalobacteraceae bacterium]